MKNTEISFFLPTRKGSKRVPNKNTRTFAGVAGGLLALKLQQLSESKHFTEIILSTNDEECIRIAREFGDSRLRIIDRPDHLCLDTTPLQDLIEYVPSVVNCNHIFWGHVTTPFINGEEYDAIVEAYFDGVSKGYDSLVSVCELQNFLIDPEKGEIINSKETNEGRWPRTQDLQPLYEVNHAAFVSSINTYRELSDRIGKKKKFYVHNKIKSFDVDWEEDFHIAEAIQKSIENG